jgi:tetratricopeptide (TPR) repeat protein
VHILTHLLTPRRAARAPDAHALRLLHGAGISAKGFGDFLERLDGRPQAPAGEKQTANYEVISTHPPTADAATPALSLDDWRALREACGPASPRPADATDADREIAEATKTLEAKPNDVAALQRRGRAHARKRQHDQALADFTRAVQLKPGDAMLRVQRGQALQNLRRYEEALRDYDEAIQRAPNHVAARNGRANTNRALKRYEAALNDFDHLVRFNPKFVAAYYNRALVYVDMNQPDLAMRDLTAAIAIDKDYAGAYAQRGLLHEKLAAREPAIADFRAALAAPAKFDSGAWAHRTARARLNALGVAVP